MIRRFSMLTLALLACNKGATATSIEAGRESVGLTAVRLPLDSPEARSRREHLVAHLVALGDIRSERVRDAMNRVPRHVFVPEVSLGRAYGNYPVPIGAGQTISQPSVVAEMTEALSLDGSQRVLEIGTGSGYQAAVLSLVSAEVDTIEIIPELGERARALLSELGCSNVHVRIGDGYKGWPEGAPFDRIIVTAAPPELPRTLLGQLADGGILVAPIGRTGESQRLLRYSKVNGQLQIEDLGAVSFVPMVGE
jgi:protein-L-isoaspartate(D-aspartate) O-methyltransferase